MRKHHSGTVLNVLRVKDFHREKFSPPLLYRNPLIAQWKTGLNLPAKQTMQGEHTHQICRSRFPLFIGMLFW